MVGRSGGLGLCPSRPQPLGPGPSPRHLGPSLPESRGGRGQQDFRLLGTEGWTTGSVKSIAWVCPVCAHGNPIVSKVRQGWGCLHTACLVSPRAGGGLDLCACCTPGDHGFTAHAGGVPEGARPRASGGLGRPSDRAGKQEASALLPIFPVSVLYCFLLLKLTCLIGNWCRIVSRGLLWNISTAVSFN